MADSDDWRVTISVSGQALAGPAHRPASLQEVEEDIRRQVRPRRRRRRRG